jgi:putative sigma-54 modulation protein
MQLSVTGHHVDVTEPLRAYVENKFERLERHFDHVTNVHVILSVEKLRQKAEATLHLNGGNLFADDVQEDMYGFKHMEANAG